MIQYPELGGARGGNIRRTTSYDRRWSGDNISSECSCSILSAQTADADCQKRSYENEVVRFEKEKSLHTKFCNFSHRILWISSESHRQVNHQFCHAVDVTIDALSNANKMVRQSIILIG